MHEEPLRQGTVAVAMAPAAAAPALRVRDLRDFIIASQRAMERIDHVAEGEVVILDAPEVVQQRLTIALLLTLADTRGKKCVYIAFHRPGEYMEALLRHYCRSPANVLLVEAGRGIDDEGRTPVRFVGGPRVHDLFRGMDHRVRHLAGEERPFVNLEMMHYVFVDHLQGISSYLPESRIDQFIQSLRAAGAGTKIRPIVLLDQGTNAGLYDIVAHRAGATLDWRDIAPPAAAPPS